VITGENGDHAKSLLDWAGIRIYWFEGTGTIKKVLDEVNVT